MNHLVFLDARAGELEKILSGVKTMLIKEIDPAQSSKDPVNPSDSLYFLRNHEDCAVRVRATVVRVLHMTNQEGENLSHALKEMQTRLQLTENQFNFWIANPEVQLVEFRSAHKIDPFQVDSTRIQDRSDWISFEGLQ